MGAGAVGVGAVAPSDVTDVTFGTTSGTEEAVDGATALACCIVNPRIFSMVLGLTYPASSAASYNTCASFYEEKVSDSNSKCQLFPFTLVITSNYRNVWPLHSDRSKILLRRGANPLGGVNLLFDQF